MPPRLMAGLAVWPIIGALVAAAAGLAVPHLGPAYDPRAIPAYISPGDRVSVELPVELESVKGHWRGRPECTVTNTDEIGVPIRLTGTGSDATWPETIPKGTPEQFYPQVTFRIPDDERLVHKTLLVRVQMEVTYPAPLNRDGMQRYVDRKESIDATVPVRITDTGTTTWLLVLWWAAAVFVVLCVVLPTLVLAWVCNRLVRNLTPPALTVVRSPEAHR